MAVTVPLQRYYLFLFNAEYKVTEEATEHIISPKLSLSYMLDVEQTSQLVPDISHATGLTAQF